GEGEHHGEGCREAADVGPQRRSGKRQDDEQGDISCKQGTEAAEPRIAFRRGTERLRDVGPNRRGDNPTEQIRAPDPPERQGDHQEPDQNGEPIFRRLQAREELERSTAATASDMRSSRASGASKHAYPRRRLRAEQMAKTDKLLCRSAYSRWRDRLR